MEKILMTTGLCTAAFLVGINGLHAGLPLSESSAHNGADRSSNTPLPQTFTASLPKQVVELFTSQGCSSCPRANALLGELSKQDGVLGLSYSVEYWDYLGWQDTFANPDFSDRQRSYSTAIGHERVYTPQIVVNGSFDKPRLNKAEVLQNIIDRGGNGPDITLGHTGTLSLGDANVTSATVRLIRYVPGEQSVPVNAGENRGRIVTLTNVVTGIDEIGRYFGKAQDYQISPAELTAASDTGASLVILVQKDDCSTILAAANYSL